MGICLIVKSGGGVDTSDANATAGTILSGYTIYKDDTKITGTMVNVGNQNNIDTTWGNNGGKYNCWPDGTIWIWEGWHDGTSGVNAVSLASQTGGFDMPGTDYCLWGYTYWTDGNRYSGTMPALGKQTWTLGANGTQTIGWGWHDGTGTVSQSIPVDDTEWGSGGATSNIQLCWPGWYYSKNRWCYGANTLTADNIKKGVVIYGITGTWETTRRYIIQDGAATGLCTISADSSTKSWNGATWRLLCNEAWSYIDSDEGTQRQWNYDMTLQDFNSMFSISYTEAGVVRLGFSIGLDAITTTFNGTTSPAGSVGVSMWFCYKAKSGSSRSAPWFAYCKSSGTIWTSGVNTIAAGSLTISGACSGGTSTSISGTGWTPGRLSFDVYGNAPQYQHDTYGSDVWVRNLWFDTAGSLTYR